MTFHMITQVYAAYLSSSIDLESLWLRGHFGPSSIALDLF